MNKQLSVACAVLALLVSMATKPAFAGEIELGGKWFTFEELIPSQGPVAESKRQSGLTSYGGKENNLLKQPARILVLSGREWSTYGNVHLAKRFWPLVNPALTVKNWSDGGFKLIAEHVLVPSFKTESGWYEFAISLRGTREQIFHMFRMLADVAEQDQDDRSRDRGRSCIELRGQMTWFGLYNPNNPTESKYTYTLLVESVTVNGKISRGGIDESPAPSLEAATKLCS